MKYIDEFRDGALARRLAATIAGEADPLRSYNLMEFCGGHTHAISRYGVADLLPPPVRMIHGPGCPVCVLPIGRIDLAIQLALEQRVIERIGKSHHERIARAGRVAIQVEILPDIVTLLRHRARREVVQELGLGRFGHKLQGRARGVHFVH